MAFVTKVDYSDNRQVKQFQLTNTKLSGSTQFGVTYSALTGGVDESTVVTIGTLADINSTFSGNSQETIFFFGDSRMNPAVEGITPITDENSGDVQTVIGFEGNDFIEVDGNIVYENYTGVTFDLTVTSIREINTGEFTGTTNSQVVTLLSGSSLDFSERTIWVDVKGITRSEKLILVDEPALDNSLSKVLARDSEGEIRSVDRNDISGVTYNELNNTLTLERSGNAPDLTTIIPSYSSSSDDNDYVTGATINNDILEFTRLSGGTFTLDLNDTFIPYQGANSTINLNQQDVLNVDDITANSFITDGGNSNQFVKGDGSLDSTSYVTGTTTDITNWNEAYADKINSISVSGTTVKTITLTTQSGDTLSADFNDTDTTYTAGGGLTLVGTEFSHDDTSSQNSSINAGRTYIQSLEIDDFGHITGLSAVTETTPDTTYDLDVIDSGPNPIIRLSGSDLSEDDVNLIGGSNVILSASGDTITIESTDTDTTYTAGDGIILNNTEFSHDDTSSLTSTNNSNRTYIQNIEVDGFGHITGVTTADETLVDTNDYVNDVSFNTSTGEFTLTTLSGNTITENLDGRYLTGFTDTNTTYTAGDAIDLIGTEFNHADTSSQNSTNNSGRTYIQNIELDDFGHITGLTTASETFVNTNTTYNTSVVNSGSDAIIRLSGSDVTTDDITLVAGNNITLTPSGDDITIESTNTDTTYTAGDGINLVGTEFNHDDTSTETSSVNADRTYIQSIELDDFGHITNILTGTETVVNTDTTYTAGGGIDLVGAEFSHADTSTQGSSTNGGRTYIQTIELDDFGHITDLTTSTETVVNTDTNTTYATSVINSGSDAIIRLSGSDTSQDDIRLIGGSNVILSASGDNITIESTDTNTTYTAGDGIILNNTEFSHDDTSSLTSTNNSDRTYIQNIEVDDFGHITGVTTASETVINTDTNTTYTAGDGINLVGTEFNHEDTSSLASTNNSNRTYIQNIEVDDFGHITGLTTADETVTNTDTTYIAGDGINLVGTEFSHEDTSSLASTNNSNRTYIQNIEVDGFGHITGVTTSSETVVDTNTTYTAGDGIDLSSSEFSHTDTSSQASSTNGGRTYIQSVELDGFGHVTDLTTASETVINTDTNFYLDELTFNTTNGILTASIDGTTNQTVDLDGRYALSSDISTVNNNTININAGSALTGGGSFTLNQGSDETITVNHADTSTQTSSVNAGRTYIQSVEVDDFGHITDISTSTETVVNTDTTYNLSALDYNTNVIIRLTGSDTTNDDVTLVAGTNITLTPSGSDITIDSDGGELIKVDEGNGDGYILKDRVAGNYGNIGLNAIDFSFSNNSSTTKGATGAFSFAEGFNTIASGDYSYAGGYFTEASGFASHAEGNSSVDSGDNSHAENRSDATGFESHAEGSFTEASGQASHSQGQGTLASGYGSHAEGNFTEASGNFSHAEGLGTVASGLHSHAEGENTEASGIDSHAEGVGSIANKSFAHAEGNNTRAYGEASHTEGAYVFARAFGEHSGGIYGTDYTPFSGSSEIESHPTDRLVNYANGVNSQNRSDAFTIYKNGAVRFYRNELSNITNTDKEGLFIYDSDNSNRPTIHDGVEWRSLAYENDITNFTETDPTVPSHVKNITTGDISNWDATYDDKINTITVTGGVNKVITLTQQDGTTLTASFEDNNDGSITDIKINALGFNSADGVLTATRDDSITVTTSLDGRYSLLNHTHTISDITNFPVDISYFNNDAGYITSFTDTYVNDVLFDTSNGVLTLDIIGGANQTADLDGRYVDLSNTQTIGGEKTFTSNSIFNGDVGIGTDTPSARLDVNGNIKATKFYQTSLRDFKTNIKDYKKGCLDLIGSLNIVEFDYKDGGGNNIGIIADDSSSEFLSEEKDSVNLYNTLFIQAKAIQELNSKVSNQENNINSLQNQINELKKLITNG